MYVCMYVLQDTAAYSIQHTARHSIHTLSIHSLSLSPTPLTSSTGLLPLPDWSHPALSGIHLGRHPRSPLPALCVSSTQLNSTPDLTLPYIALHTHIHTYRHTTCMHALSLFFAVSAGATISILCMYLTYITFTVAHTHSKPHAL